MKKIIFILTFFIGLSNFGLTQNPAPICITGLAIELMPIALADADGDGDLDAAAMTILATDFIASPNINIISYSINKVGDPVDISTTSLVLTCDDLSTTPVEIHGWDVMGNNDFCESFVLVQTTMVSCTSIEGIVWEDLDGNGNMDIGEPNFDNVLVYMDTNNNGVLDVGESSTQTNPLGQYRFSVLSAGSYVVRVVNPNVSGGSVFTTNNNYSVTLTDGENATGPIIGIQVQDASIGSLVWSDDNWNGIQDNGEVGIPGVVIYLDLNGNGLLDFGEPSEITIGDGSYTFANLAIGAYTVRIDPTTIPMDLLLTTANDPLVINLTQGQFFDMANFGLAVVLEIPTLTSWGLLVLLLLMLIVGNVVFQKSQNPFLQRYQKQ